MGEKKPKKSISTGKGDKGRTSFLDGSRAAKGSVRPEAYGTLDEASAFIGLARSKSRLEAVRDGLLKAQNLIYRVNSELACPSESRHLLKRVIAESDVEEIAALAGRIESDLKLPPRFVLYGEEEVSALLDLARAVVRRAERAIARLDEEESLDNPSITAFINRLSDLLFLMARLEERESGCSSRHPD